MGKPAPIARISALFRRTAQGDDRDRRPRRLCARHLAPERRGRQTRELQSGRRRHEPLREPVRDRAETGTGAPDHRRNGARLRQRRRFPTLGATRRRPGRASSPTPTRSSRIRSCCTPRSRCAIRLFKYYRFQTPDDNLVDYYDENGRSTRKFLIRKPIVGGEMTSAVRHALPSDPALRENAHRRRLGRADRHADPGRRQRRRHSGGAHLGLWPSRR